MELTVNDIVKIFAVSEETVNHWIDKKGMPCIKANDQYRFNYIELLDWALHKRIQLTPEVLNFADREHHKTNILYQAIKKGRIYYDLPGDNREEVLKSVVDVLPLPAKTNKKSLWQMLIAREKLVSTSMGNGIAIPHVRNPVVLNIDQPSVTLCFLKNPIDFKAPDGKPVYILFVLLSTSVKEHLTFLSRIAYSLQSSKLQEYLQSKATPEEILAEIMVLESKFSFLSSEIKRGARKI